MNYEVVVPRREFIRIKEGSQTFHETSRSLEVQRGDLIQIFPASETKTNEVTSESDPPGPESLWFIAGFVSSTGIVSLLSMATNRERDRTKKILLSGS